MKDIVAVAMAVIGLAMLAILIKNAQGTSSVLNSGFSGFSGLIKAASGG
jgi:hypothetical protein